jgi:hypothetical protein
MSKPSMAELRAKFKAKADNKGKNSNMNTEVYPFWNLAVDSSSTVRLLPDKNEDNENYFYVDRLEHKISINGTDRKIPCIRMFDEKCPICDLSSKFYKDEGRESERGKYYWIKRTSLMKALIIKDGIDYSGGEESAEGQVKTLMFTYQVMKPLTTALHNDDEELALEELPWDMDAGYNFIIQKTKQGNYDNYGTSSFSTKQSAVPSKWLEVAEDGMVDLSTLLPENPGFEKVQALLEAHLGGTDVEEEEEAPPVRTGKSETTSELPTRRKPVAEETEEEEAPVARRRKPVAEETEEEEAPVARRRKPVAEETEEEEVPVARRRRVVEEVAETDDDGDGDDENDDIITRRLRARKAAKSE